MSFWYWGGVGLGVNLEDNGFLWTKSRAHVLTQLSIICALKIWQYLSKVSLLSGVVLLFDVTGLGQYCLFLVVTLH